MKLLSSVAIAALFAASPALAFPESVRAVHFDGHSTFLTNGGYDSHLLWCAFGCHDVVYNIVYKIPGTLASADDVAVLIAAEAPLSNGDRVPIFNITYINKPNLDRSLRGFWHIFAGDLERNSYIVSTFPGSVVEDGHWHILTITLSMDHKSNAFPYYRIIISHDATVVRIDPQRTFAAGKYQTIRVPFFAVKKWFIGAIDHNGGRPGQMRGFFEGDLAGHFLHSWDGDWATSFANPRVDAKGNPLIGFADYNLSLGTATLNDFGQNGGAIFGAPEHPEDGVYPGICMPYGPTSWIENQYQIDPNSEFVMHGYLRDARDSPYDEGALKP